jgi:hypothetical protein
MRIRSYYSDNEILTSLYTFGKEWQLPDGIEYKGLYHKYIPTGEVYTEGTWNRNKSVKLTEYIEIPEYSKLYRKIKSDIKIGTESPVPIVSFKPTLQDYSTGYINRYFLKRVNNDLIYEVDDIQYYDQLSNVIDLHLYTGAIVKWFITGETTDTTSGVAIVPGVITKNKQAIREAEKQISGISKLVTNLLQYYEDTDYVVPKDINEY